MWTNYGDVNFIEHGGCQVKKTYSDEEIKRYPRLNSTYDVFFVYREDETIIATLCTVDVDDSWINLEDVLYPIGLEDRINEKYGGLQPDFFAKECVETLGYMEFSPIFYKDSIYLTEEELIRWMDVLEIEC